MRNLGRWPFMQAALWGTWRLIYTGITVLVVAFMAPIVGITAWPIYHWLGVGWSVILWALLIWGTRFSRRPQWYSDARKVRRDRRTATR
jgi:hypothetical protein